MGKNRRAHSRRRKQVKRQSRLPWAIAAIAAAGLVIVAVLLAWPKADPSAVTIESGGTPNLSVDQEQIDFGNVPVNQMVKAEFKLSNTGDGALTISHPPAPEVVEGC